MYISPQCRHGKCDECPTVFQLDGVERNCSHHCHDRECQRPATLKRPPSPRTGAAARPLQMAARSITVPIVVESFKRTGILGSNPVYNVLINGQYYAIEVEQRIGLVPSNPLDPRSYTKIVQVKKLTPTFVEMDPAILDLVEEEKKPRRRSKRA